MPGSHIPQGERVPAELVVPFIEEYLAKYDTEGYTNDFGQEEGAKLEKLGPLGILADEAGVSSSTLRKYLEGQRTSIPFDTVDALFTKMGRPGLWRTPALWDVYYGAQLRLKPWEEEIVSGSR